MLGSVTDVLEAMKPGAPVLHERLATMANPNMRTGGLRDDDDAAESSNIANHFYFEMGDIEQGFKDADIVVEREFRTQSVHQGYIEPHTATVNWGPDGDITVWSSSQGHFNVRDQVALVCGVPISRIKAIPMEIGGGFGGKTLVYLEPVAAVLSPQDRPSRQAKHEPFRGLPRFRPDGRVVDALQGRGHQRRAHHRS